MTGRQKTPLWQAIARSLRGDIADQVYGAGDKLPTEAQLAERFGVNRHTVRHAIRALATEGLVRTRRGAGVFVTAAPTEYPIGKRVRFHQNIAAGGQAPQKRILQIEERPATASEGDALMVAQGSQLCICRGVSLADGTPIALFSSHFPAERLPVIAAALAEQTGVTEALHLCGVADYTRVSTRISARLATATQALHLHLEEGAPLVYSTSLNADVQGCPVEFGKTWFAGDRVTLTIDGAV